MDKKLTYTLELGTAKFTSAVKDVIGKMTAGFTSAGDTVKKALAPNLSSYKDVTESLERAKRLTQDIADASGGSLPSLSENASLKQISEAKKQLEELIDGADDTSRESLEKLKSNVEALESSVAGTIKGQYEILQDTLSGMKFEPPKGFVADEESARILEEMQKTIESISSTKVDEGSGLSELFKLSDKLEESQEKLSKMKEELQSLHPDFDFSDFGDNIEGMIESAKERAGSLETVVDQSSNQFSMTHIRGNMRNAEKELKGGIGQFLTDVKGTNTVAGMADAFVGLGQSGVSALTKLFNPYMQAIALGTAAFLGVKKLCEQYEELEKVALRARFAFSTGGAASGASVSDYERMARSLSANGAVSSASVMEGVGGLRMNSRSIDDETMKQLVEMSPDLAAFTGQEAGQAIEGIGKILDSTSTSYEELRDIGVDVNRQELETINILKEQGRHREANVIIMDKLKKATEGASKAEANTLSGQWKRFGGMMSEMMVDIGDALAPILRGIMDIVLPIIEAIKHLISIISALIKPIMLLVELIGKGIGYVLKLVSYLVGSFGKIFDFFKWVFGTKKKDKKEKFVDPRIEFGAGFEGLASMNQRIQSSLISKNSPQARMVELLTSIKDGVDYIKENGRESLLVAQDNVKATKEINVGATY